jgi:hypothetical protein
MFARVAQRPLLSTAPLFDSNELVAAIAAIRGPGSEQLVEAVVSVAPEGMRTPELPATDGRRSPDLDE